MRNTLSINNSFEAGQKARELTREGIEWQNHSSSLRGRGTFEGYAWLPEEYRTDCRNARFWVYSYGTPIAWVTSNGELIRPSVKYSLTTSKHQGRIY